VNQTALAVIQPDELDTIQRTAKLLAASGYFGTSQDGIVGMAQVAAKILAGRELGFGPFAAVNGIHLIQGKPTVGANLMAAAVRAHPRYDYRVKELSDTACELEFYDNGKPAGSSRFTAEDAATAELSSGRNGATWKKFPRNMLFARAMSNGVRWFAPDIFSGNAVYVPEELGAEVDMDGNVVEVAPHVIETPTKTNDRPIERPERVTVEEDGDVLFEKPSAKPAVQPPTDEELDVLGTWKTPEDAKAWAVQIGACENEFEAKNSFKKIVDDHGGRLTKENVASVYLAFLRRQYEKLEAQPQFA